MKLSRMCFFKWDQFAGKVRLQGPVYINSVRPAVSELVNKKISDFNNWYTKALGLDEVRLYQDRVVALQEKLLAAQDQRREASRQLADIRKKSNILQDEIHKVKRQENLQRFLDLMREETDVLKQELEISRHFQEWDQTERELFTAFTNAVRDSHEKQRAQLEYTKYFGLVLSIAGSFLAFCYSTLRKHDLKVFIEDQLRHIIEDSTLDKQRTIEAIVSQINKSIASAELERKIITTNEEIVDIVDEEVIRIDKAETRVLFYVGVTCAAYLILKWLSS